MFGQTDDNQAGGTTPTAQVPSMLDNVSAQDFQIADPAQQQQTPVQQSASQPTPQYDPQFQQQAPQAPIYQPSNDNPFTQNPISPSPSEPVAQSAPVEPTHFGTFANYSAQPLTSPSGPVEPPVVIATQDATGSSGESLAVSGQPSSAPVDQAKLADMKQQALSHLEPLADHLDGTPEETFKTTMMMIQANDNHTLLEKALNAAKEIEDDKARAQAMLDIVNEINYFSQDN
jgi:hypothetical protein